MVLLNFLSLLHFSTSTIINLLHAHVLLAATQLRRVDRNEKTLDATLFGMLHVLLRDLTIAVDVELQEECLVVGLRVDNVVN